MINLHNKAFITVTNTPNGDTNSDTVFLYKQHNNHITGEYKGGTIKSGRLTGTLDNEGFLEMQYHHTNKENKLLTGICHSKVELMENGKIRITEDWQWTCRDYSKGRSILEEIDPEVYYNSL